LDIIDKLIYLFATGNPSETSPGRTRRARQPVLGRG
jgi:hypothetical protein